jgi:hypothetical protein
MGIPVLMGAPHQLNHHDKIFHHHISAHAATELVRAPAGPSPGPSIQTSEDQNICTPHALV